MTFKIKNVSNYVVAVCVNDELNFDIFPQQTKRIELSGENLNISVHQNKNSRIKNDLYYIVLKSNYEFTKLSESEEFIISSKENRFAYNAFYEYIVVNSSTAICISNSNVALDVEYIKKKNRQKSVLKLFYGPFVNFLDLSVLWLVIGILLIIIFNLKSAIIYFLITYILLFFLNLFIDVIIDSIFKKAAKFNEKKEFESYLTTEYIAQHYLIPWK